MSDELFGMSEEQHMDWLRAQGVEILDLSIPSEENLIRLVSESLRTVEVDAKARQFVNIANMCLALADKSLGAQVLVPQCLVYPKH